MLTALAIALLFARNRAMLAPAMIFAIAVGWSRIALGVHWPSDVIAGLGFGLMWAGLASHWLLKARLASS